MREEKPGRKDRVQAESSHFILFESEGIILLSQGGYSVDSRGEQVPGRIILGKQEPRKTIRIRKSGMHRDGNLENLIQNIWKIRKYVVKLGKILVTTKKKNSPVLEENSS